jgi:PAS domain S-box-containing protein
VLLDLGLPDSFGLETLVKLRIKFSYLPVVIMTGSGDESLGVQAVQLGAQDYLVKGQVNSIFLHRALVYAIERKKTDEALKEKERFLQHVAELNPAIISVIDLWNGKVIYSSKSWPDLLGYPRDQVDDETAFSQSIFSPDDVERMAAVGIELKDANDDCVREIEVRLKDAKGRLRWFQMLYVVFKRDHEGLPQLSMSVARDITERKEAEQIKDNFIGMVSHELKTPLTVIMGTLTVLAEKELSEKQAGELLRGALNSTDTMATIVENLLELSRSQANRLLLRSEPSDIVTIARDVARDLQGRSAIHRLSIDPPVESAIVSADPVRIERILHNLMENAIKYSPGGGEIMTFIRKDGNYLLVGVRDQGIGISKEDQGRLFQSFERLGIEFTAKSIQGTGLGLKVCRILVEAHGGRIWVESEAGKGSTFFFTLPAANKLTMNEEQRASARSR